MSSKKTFSILNIFEAKKHFLDVKFNKELDNNYEQYESNSCICYLSSTLLTGLAIAKLDFRV